MTCSRLVRALCGARLMRRANEDSGPGPQDQGMMQNAQVRAVLRIPVLVSCVRGIVTTPWCNDLQVGGAGAWQSLACRRRFDPATHGPFAERMDFRFRAASTGSILREVAGYDSCCQDDDRVAYNRRRPHGPCRRAWLPITANNPIHSSRRSRVWAVENLSRRPGDR